jgi:hypothetical protein
MTMLESEYGSLAFVAFQMAQREPDFPGGLTLMEKRLLS